MRPQEVLALSFLSPLPLLQATSARTHRCGPAVLAKRDKPAVNLPAEAHIARGPEAERLGEPKGTRRNFRLPAGLPTSFNPTPRMYDGELGNHQVRPGSAPRYAKT